MGSEARCCILVVDDDARNLLALESILARHRHRLVRATDGPGALERFEEDAPDLVLCDLMMPGMDGVEVLGRIRAHPERWHTPVVLVTAHGDEEQRMRALRAGVDDFLEQPIDAAFLTARVATLLRLKRSRDDLALQHAELQRLQEEQRRLLDFVARDMTAPARTLASAVDRLEAGGEATTITAPVAHMRRALHHLFAMVDDLIWVSRLENAATPVRRDVVALDRLVERVTAGFAARATERGIRLECASRPRVAVPADETLVARVLENLLDNALRYAPEGGGVRVDLRRDRGAEIRVCNDGPAIAPVERRRIFRKFERGVTDPPSAGHPGLGLYFCKRVVDAHQGEIAVVDVPEWSTCFSVWLPEATPARVAAPSPSQDLGP